MKLFFVWESILTCNFTKSNTPPLGVFHVFQFTQMVPNRATYHIYAVMKLLIPNVRNVYSELLSDHQTLEIFKKSKLHSYIRDFQKKQATKLHKNMNLTKKHTLMNTFFKSQFNFFALITMSHSRENNNNRIYERRLRIKWNDK